MSYVAVPPDGAGKKIFTTEHTISGNTVQIQNMHLASQNNPTQAVEIDDKGALYTRFTEGSPILSSFGDLKTIQEHILGVYEYTLDSYDDLFYMKLSGGTSTWDHELSSNVLAVDDKSGSIAERTTNRHHYYQMGTSILILCSVTVGDTGKANNRRSWGYFNDNNGVFFDLSGTTMGITQRSNITGTIVDTFIPQTEWNVDKLDGLGLSRLLLNVTKGYQYFININWPVGDWRNSMADHYFG